MSARLGDWIQTYTGLKFYVLDPRPEEIVPEDIAHALSLKCRYNGHCREFYCPTSEQRVLTADLRWVPSGDLRVGDELVGFDERPRELGSAGNRRRRFRHSTVLTARPVKRRVVRLEMADGSTVRSSSEHPWLIATKASRNQKWVTAKEVADAIRVGHARYMHRFVIPWDTDLSWGAGWLAGILDGEGHISFVGRTGVQFGVAQRPGLVLKEIESGFARLGFAHTSRSVGTSDVQPAQVLGGWREMVRLLGTTRPVRLLNKFTGGLRNGRFDKQLDGVGEPQRIIAAYDEGEEWVAGLETSTHTYICEGYGAHNSVAQHSCLVADAVATRTASPALAQWALLHDAAEAYLPDVPRPIKRMGTGIIDRCEEAIMKAVAIRFNLDTSLVDPELGMPRKVKEVDTAILWDERGSLMRRSEAWEDWDLPEPPLGILVEPWAPMAAENAFLKMMRVLELV